MIDNFVFDMVDRYLNVYIYGSVMDKNDHLFYPAYYDNRGNLNVQINNSFSESYQASDSMIKWLKNYIS